MPVVGIPLHYLRRFYKEDQGIDALVAVFHEMGCSVDGIESAQRRICKGCGETAEYVAPHAPDRCGSCGREFRADGVDFEEAGPMDVVRLELLANRPDNFDAPGIARSLNGYRGVTTGLQSYSVEPSAYEVFVDESVGRENSYRPSIACAVINDVVFDDDTIKSLMKLQENLHWALGRNRKFGAIGVYDLKNLHTTIRYSAVKDEDVRFVPLDVSGESPAMSPREILSAHPKGKDFAHLLEGFDRYPLLMDEKGAVLSMPPIINSESTRVKKKTTDLFIDVTGLNAQIPLTMLNILVASIKDAVPGCRIRGVTIHFPDHETVTPLMTPSPFRLDFNACRDLLGRPLSNAEIIDCLKRMRYDARENGDHADVLVPCYRSDIRHEQDLIEDVAIAHGYKNLAPRNIRDFTIGAILPAEKKKQELREALTGLGFLEIVSIMLTSEEREFEKLGLPVKENRVIIENPISADQTMVRTGLTSGIIEILANNTSNELPQRVFETGEVVCVDETTGAPREDVSLGVGIVDSRAGFSDIKSVLKNLMHEMGHAWELTANDCALYSTGRSGTIISNGQAVGHLGEVHPKVLDTFKISNPAAVLEIDLSKLGFIR
ncbi:MAG: phenylalanine--tRNA ligase subunit beta [Chitinivibrionales bacterium]